MALALIRGLHNFPSPSEKEAAEALRVLKQICPFARNRKNDFPGSGHFCAPKVRLRTLLFFETRRIQTDTVAQLHREKL